jgi:hypothetical protein
MRKFKLVKKFPTSPPLGTVLELKPNGWYEKEGHHSYPYQKNYVEDQPEYWEEIVERDFEILEVKGIYGAISSYIEKLDADLKDKSIYKIKRLSDGEVFCLGDKAKDSRYGFIGTIDKFKVNGSSIYVSSEENVWGQDLSKLVKYEEPKVLFKTLDGQEMKFGDKFYVVDTKYFKIFEAEAGITFKTEKWIKNSYFDKKFAEEWILNNKPVLSLNDLLSVWGAMENKDFYAISPLFKNFKEIAENKIKENERL